ncbi:MAG: hypothetical protein IT395_03870 [Candidatus Omnitrophica bacterium]|nr:hypothetical protein [Candidatus Omnitrophota bacterium]
MKRLFLIGFCFILGGCETAPVSSVKTADPQIMQRRFISTSQVRNGLTRQEVAGLLGKEVVAGYSLTDEASGEYSPITILNPQRTETIQNGKKSYAVDYYLVGIKAADEKVSDDELVPVVFLNDRVVGMGWDFLDQRVKGQ